jgi:signal transduction histidine kinase
VSLSVSAGSVGSAGSAGSAGSVELTVRDDGVGPNDEPTSGTGLRDMAARAEALGGTFAIEPNEPLGTAVSWRVPLP